MQMEGFPYEARTRNRAENTRAQRPIFSAHRLEGRFSDPKPHLEARAASSRRATRPFFLKVPRWGTAGAYRRRPRRATDGRPSKCPAAWGDAGRRGLPPCTLGGGWAKGGKKRATEKLAPSLGGPPLCTTSGRRCCSARAARAKTEREEQGDRSRSRKFSGLRRAELACLRRAEFGLRRFSFGLRRQTNQAEEPGPRQLSTHLLAHAAWIGFASKWQQANPPVVVQQHASLLFRSFLLPAGCNSYGAVVLCLT